MSLQSALELPREVERGLMVLTALGQKELHIENHRGILAFSTQEVRVLGKGGRLVVRGDKLWIRRYDRDEIDLVGVIREISFL